MLRKSRTLALARSGFASENLSPKGFLFAAHPLGVRVPQTGGILCICASPSFSIRSGALRGTRTPDPLLRRQMLYPTELSAQIKCLIIIYAAGRFVKGNPKIFDGFLSQHAQYPALLFYAHCRKHIQKAQPSAFLTAALFLLFSHSTWTASIPGCAASPSKRCSSRCSQCAASSA